jgi:hypothetical protein
VSHRRPASRATVVVLAAIGALLSGSAGTASYLGTSQYLHDQPFANPGPTATSTPSTTTPAATRTTPPAATSTTTPFGEQCPSYTVKAVKEAGEPANLTMLLHVEGTHLGRHDSEAWICQDSDGTLYYQGHDEDGNPPDPATNTMLLGKNVRGTVVRQGSTPDGSAIYLATNPGENGEGPTTYRVSPKQFTVLGPDGTTIDFIITHVLAKP